MTHFYLKFHQINVRTVFLNGNLADKVCTQKKEEKSMVLLVIQKCLSIVSIVIQKRLSMVLLVIQ